MKRNEYKLPFLLPKAVCFSNYLHDYSNSKWKSAKLMLLESLYRRFSYEVNTNTGPLTVELHDRAAMWREDYLTLKKEIRQESCSVPRFASGGSDKPPYFYAGMQENERTKGIRIMQG